MFSVVYSLWGSAAKSNPSFAFSMFLSFGAWASGLYAAIPEYALVDTFLTALTMFHLFVVINFVSVADAVYKRPLTQLHYNFAKFFYDTPLAITSFNVVLTWIAIHLAWRAYTNPDNNADALRLVISTYSWVCAMVLQKLSISLVKLGVDFVMATEQAVEKHDLQSWKEPPAWIVRLFTGGPFMWTLRPEVMGEENIPTDHPGLYVTNHGLWALEMVPFVTTVYRLKGVYLRGVSDKFLFGNVVGEFVRYFGGFNGTRANMGTVMENNDNILIYPGGAHELMKPCAIPKYTLMWKQRLGFARMAIKHGYPIIPCASVGTEDMMDKLFDVNLGLVRNDLKAPVVLILPHRLQKLYVWFGESISTDQYNGDWQNDEYAKEVRDLAKAAVERGIRELQERQARDPNRFLLHHMANVTKEAIGAMVEFCNPTSATKKLA